MEAGVASLVVECRALPKDVFRPAPHGSTKFSSDSGAASSLTVRRTFFPGKSLRGVAGSSGSEVRRRQNVHRYVFASATNAPKFLPQFQNARQMEDVYMALADHLAAAANNTEPPSKYVVALAGPPGAGKSTVAGEVASFVNSAWRKKHAESADDVAVAVPMDGFHLYRWQLDQMEDPKEAHARRGAPWTFDPASLVVTLESIRREGHGSLPSFDHGTGDPKENDIFVREHHRVVIVEGNYLLLQSGDWARLAPLFDETWYLNCDVDEAMARVEKRHVSTGKPPDVAKWRVAYNDKPNALLIAETKKYADLVIPSLHMEKKVPLP